MLASNARKSSIFLRLLRDERGNFGIMFALLVPVLLGSASMAIDVSQMMSSKTRLSAIADAASLAASSAMASQKVSEKDARALALNYIDGQLGTTIGAKGNSATRSAEVKINTSMNAGYGKVYDVTVNIAFEVPLSGLGSMLGPASRTINVTSSSQSATGSRGALSMYLVLDRSGSMAWNTDTLAALPAGCANSSDNRHRFRGEEHSNQGNGSRCARTYIKKIEALKLSVQNLAAKLHEADPKNMYVRTGAISFNSSSQRPIHLDWGETGIVSYVNALSAYGGTDSSDAMKQAYRALKRSREDNAHKRKNGQTPKKYIVFMTDGENNDSSSDRATKKWCDRAKAKDIQIYTIGFMAPSRGKALLGYCATDASHYFDAKDAKELYSAFDAIGKAAASQISRLTN